MFQYKVEICGVDTSKLKVLKEKEKQELLVKAHSGDEAAREKLIEGNLRLVLSAMQIFGNRGENPDDIFQVGCIGLMKAIDNFDLTQNVKLSTYAFPMIVGEIRRYLRDSSPIRVSRSMKDIAYKAMQIKEELTAQKGSEPTAREIAEKMGVSEEDVVLSLEAMVEPISLYEPVYNDAGDTIYVMDQVGDRMDNDESWINEIVLKESIKNLSQREKTILSLRFFAGKTQMEVAREIDISQAQVSRIEKGAIDRIKQNLR